MNSPRFHLGGYRLLNDASVKGQAHLPAHHLVTHAFLAGMTGSGKTGLLMVMIEEALRAEVPVLVIDVKGDLPNLLLRFPELSAEALRERVVDGLGDSGPDAALSKSEVSNVIKKLAPRWFLLRDAHAREGMMLLQPRWAMTLMLGPMTRTEIKRARQLAQAGNGEIVGTSETYSGSSAREKGIESVKVNAPAAGAEG